MLLLRPAHAGVKLIPSPLAELPALTPILSKTPLQRVLQGCCLLCNTKQVSLKKKALDTLN